MPNFVQELKTKNAELETRITSALTTGRQQLHNLDNLGPDENGNRITKISKINAASIVQEILDELR